MESVMLDTSVWIEYLKTGISGVEELLRNEETTVLTHQMILGELLLNNRIKNEKVFVSLKQLLQAPTASQVEYERFIKENSIPGCGIGYVDTNILASCKKHGASLWTLDKKLNKVALRLGCAWQH